MEMPNRLKIVHVVRSPIGGIFRHIVDLVDAQATAGHDVGIICDSLTGGQFENEVIASIAPRLTLGASRVPMRRSVSLSDFVAMRHVLEHLAKIGPDVLHCHGAKGGAYGRVVAAWLGRQRPIASIYAPHGGSLHFDEGSLEGMFYFRVERMLERVTDALVHVSAYEAGVYRDKIGIPRCRTTIIHNGLREEEFVPVTPMPYVVLEAIAAGMPVIATDVGGIPEIFGPDAGALVPPGDAAALARAIEAALADPRRTDAEAAARRAWLRPRFNISTMQSKIEALYRLMLEGKYADAA